MIICEIFKGFKIKYILSFLILICSSSYSLDFYTTNLPPYSVIKEDSVHGPIMEILKRACKDIKKDCSFNNAPWKRIMTNVRRGSYSGCFVFGKNEKRKKWAYYTTPLVQTEYGFFFLSDRQSPIKSFKDLQDKKVIVHEKSNTHKSILELYEKHPIFEIVTFVDIETILKMYANQRFDKSTYLFGNKDILLHMAKSQGHKSVKYSLEYVEFNYHIGLSKRSVSYEDFNLLNNALIKLKKQKFYQQVLTKYDVTAPKT